jgi:hypothetical protein
MQARSQKKNEVLTVHLEIKQEGDVEDGGRPRLPDRDLLQPGAAGASSPPPLSSRKRSGREEVRRVVAPARDVSASLSIEPQADQQSPQPSPSEWMRESRLKQGLPPVVTDPVVLHNVKTIMRAGAENKIADVVQIRPRTRRLSPEADSQHHPGQHRGDIAL